MDTVAVAAGTPLAAQMGAAIAEAGGNAVDAAVAATLVTWVCEPGLTSMGSGGFCCIWPTGAAPVTIDGFVEMPGRSAPAEAFGQIDRGLDVLAGDDTGWLEQQDIALADAGILPKAPGISRLRAGLEVHDVRDQGHGPAYSPGDVFALR